MCLKCFPFVFTLPNPFVTENLTNSSHFAIMSVIKRECIPSFLVLLQGQAWVYVVSVPSCDQTHTGGPPGVAAQALENWLWPFTPLTPSHTSFPLPCHLIFTHISFPIEAAEGSWQMLGRRNHNSCRSATYANMFTHEGILCKENLPHANSLHVCHVAPVSHSLKHEIMG